MFVCLLMKLEVPSILSVEKHTSRVTVTLRVLLNALVDNSTDVYRAHLCPSGFEFSIITTVIEGRILVFIYHLLYIQHSHAPL